MRTYAKYDYPTDKILRYLEPGPVLLVSSAWRGARNVMSMSWLTMMEFTPALVGCVISGANHSFEMIRKSKQCVINIPTADIATTVVGIGNCSGADTDKFAKFNLTAVPAEKVDAPLIAECYASFECRVADAALVNKYNFFVFEVVKAHVARRPKYPKTIHYRGNGEFMISGENTGKWRKLFRPEMLWGDAER